MYPVEGRVLAAAARWRRAALVAARPVLRTVLLHHLQKLDHHLGGWPHKHLSLATLLCIIHRLERVCEDRHAHHLALRASMSALGKCRRAGGCVGRLERMTTSVAASPCFGLRNFRFHFGADFCTYVHTTLTKHHTIVVSSLHRTYTSTCRCHRHT